MEFEQVRDIIVETLSCDADKVLPEARLARIWKPTLWPLWSWPWRWRRRSGSPSRTRM